MSRKSTSRTEVVTKQVEEVYCDICGKLTYTQDDNGHFYGDDHGAIRAHLETNGESMFFKYNDLCKSCAAVLPGKIREFLIALGFKERVGG